MSFTGDLISCKASKNTDGNSKLNRLRYHLAVEGCSDSQVSLAKSFLKDAAETDVERKENAELAVRWLLMACSEGNQEAYHLLEKCYKMGVGVTNSNRNEVEVCLRSTTHEKLAQHVGCSLFRLIAYDTQECIPLEHFQQCITLFLKKEAITENCNLSSSNNNYSSGIYISTQDVVTCVHDCLLGKCPQLRIGNTFETAIPCVQQSQRPVRRFAHHIFYVTDIYLRTLDLVCKKFEEVSLFLTLLTMTGTCFILCFFIPNLFFTSKQETSVLILEYTITWYSVMVILVTSSRMIQHDKNNSELLNWTDVIRQFDKQAADSIPHSEKWQMACNFGFFFFGLFLFIMFKSASDNITTTEQCFLLLMLLFKVTREPFQGVTCMFLLLNLIFCTKVCEWLDCFSYMSRDVLSIHANVANKMVLVKPVSVISALFIPMYLLIACSYNLRTSLGILMCSIMTRLILGNVSQVEHIYFLLSVLILIFVVKKRNYPGAFFLLLLVNRIVLQFNVLFIPGIIFVLSFKVASIINDLKTRFKVNWFYLVIVFLLIISLSCIFVMPKNFNVFQTRKHENITWSKYSSLCHHPAWSETNMVHTQLNCEHYQGSRLFFEATVSNVYMKYSHSIYMPNVLGIHTIALNCYEIVLHIKGTFRVEAEMLVQTDDRCKDFILNLQPGDLLSLNAIFQDGLGTEKPTLSLESADCLSCMEDVHCHIRRFSWQKHFLSKLENVLKFFLHVEIK